MKKNQQDAESYAYNIDKNEFDKFVWICRRCKTKNMKNTTNCYECGTRR